MYRVHPDDGTLFYVINANYDFVETMKMEMVAGRTFSRSFGSDSVNFLINERAAVAMGMEEGTRAAMGQIDELLGVAA